MSSPGLLPQSPIKAFFAEVEASIQRCQVLVGEIKEEISKQEEQEKEKLT